MSQPEQISEADQIRSFKDFLSNYNKLSEVCFNDCVWDFTNRKISRGEDSCALNCAEKFLKMNQRISSRFQVGFLPFYGYRQQNSKFVKF